MNEKRRELTAKERKYVVRLNAYMIVMEDEHREDKKLVPLLAERDELEKKVEVLQQELRDAQKNYSKSLNDVRLYLSEYMPDDLKKGV